MAGVGIGGIASGVGAVLGGLGGIFGNRQASNSPAQNMANQYSIYGQAMGTNAADWYKGGQGPNAWRDPQSLVANYSPETLAGINALYSVGQAGNAQLQPGIDYLSRLLGGSYLNSNPANAQLQQLATTGGSAYNPALAQTQQLATTGGPGYNPAMGYFQGAAGGQYLNSNPWLDAQYQAGTRSVVDQFRNAVAPSLMSGFSTAGRTGSGASQGAFGQAAQSLGNTLGDYGTNLYGNAYNYERGLQQAAAGQLGSLYNTGIGNQLAALGQVSNIFNTGIGNQLSALGQVGQNYNVERGLQQQGLSQMPAFQNAQYANANAMLQAGNLLDTQAQRRLDAPYMLASRYSGLLSGAPTAQIQGIQPQPYNYLAGGLGGALVGGQLGSQLGRYLGNATDPYGGGGLYGAWDPRTLRGDMSQPQW